MNNFSITFIDPFIRDEQELGVFSDHQIIDEFNKIPWYKNIMDSFYQESGATVPLGYVKQNGDAMVENSYWHFGIKSEYLGKKLVLFIIPNYASDSNFKENDIRFSIEFGRPKKEKTSKLARFFGSAKEKINPDFITHLNDITFNETLNIISEFSNKNLDFLENKINRLGTIY